MDKSWIDLANRWSRPYLDGIENFLTFAYINKDPGSRIYCLCRKCANREMWVKTIVRKHIRDNGFLKKYKIWDKHGESINGADHISSQNGIEFDSFMDDDMFGLVQEAIGVPDVRPHDENDVDSLNTPWMGPNEPTKKFIKLMENANLPLYPGCKKGSALSFIVRWLQAKVLHGWPDNSFQTILDILQEFMPEGVNLPSSYYEAQKLTEDLGFTYNTVDACPNSCMLFRNEDINLDACLFCNKSRWKDDGANLNDDLGPRKKRAAKQVRYFPLKPRLQRLFMCSKTAKLMRWHAEERTDDCVFRHPADSLAWKDFDKRHSSFSGDIRNVRLGLASDGFNPFRSMNIVHSTWPIILVPYNLPPMMLMKQPFIFLSVLIDGPKGPGDKIDVYMQPLIEELEELWEAGIQTFDASSNEMFQMHAALLWTISDFPAYANLSGWSTKGKYACPCCNSEIDSCWLKHGKKHSYRGHRRWLSYDHEYRQDDKSFNGCPEYRSKPKSLSGVELLAQLESNDILTEYKREDIERRKIIEAARHDLSGQKENNLKKKSIFYELPYWKHNLIRHNLDVMHVQKNVCDNVLWTILGVTGKTKDNVNSRRDLEDMGIRKNQWVKKRESGAEYYLPADFEMNNKGKDLFLISLKEVSMPEGSASNISRRVRLQDRSIGGLKSHDNQLLLQQLIPVAIRNSLPKNVVEVLIDLSKFFKQLCSKVNTAEDLENALDQIAVTLCDLEKIFPPSFFDIMEHLIVHLAEEAIIAGSVVFRWMFPIERYLGTLKEYVRNRACPEASMAKGYLMEECMNFCTQYLNDVESKWNRPLRRKNNIELEKGKDFVLDEVTRTQVHRWILFHSKAVTPFLKYVIQFIKFPFQVYWAEKNILFNGFCP